ncbi:MAG TPA: glycosyltransferase [Terracidiphilus sp.]
MNHIAFVIPGFIRIGGAERQMVELAKGLQRRGWRVSVVALSGPGGAEGAELSQSGVAFLSLRMVKGLADPRGWLRFNRWARQECPDVVHAHLPHAAWFARWSRLAAPVRVLVDTLHSSSTGTWGRKLGYRLSSWSPDLVTAVSRAAEETHLRTRMVTPGRVQVLPNGIDTRFWHPDLRVRATIRRELGLLDEFLWVAAGRLDPVKDHASLLRAFALLPGTARLVVAGDGPLQAELRRQSAGLGLEQRVRFLGFEPNVRRWFQAADALVLSSRWEGLPMVVLEAAACCVPAVATDVPGTREALRDGETGLLAAAGDVSALRDAMLQMTESSREQRRAMGLRARQMVLDHFSLEAVLDRWEELYLNLLEHSPLPARSASHTSVIQPLHKEIRSNRLY